MYPIIILFVCILSGISGDDSGIIAYDCQHNDINITSISMHYMTPCQQIKPEIKTIPQFIQVIQSKKDDLLHVRQCKIIITREIYHCGMHSHISIHANGYKKFMPEITNSKCEMYQTYGVVPIYDQIRISDIKNNSTGSGRQVIAGVMDGSSCYGSTFSSDGNTWTNVIVYYYYEITFSDYYSSYKRNSMSVTLRSGLTCNYNEGSCYDAIDGFNMWGYPLKQSCSYDEYFVLYEGVVNKTIAESIVTSNIRTFVPHLYTFLSENIVFSITSNAYTDICTYKAMITDHPDIYIVEMNQDAHIKPFNNRDVNIKDMSIFTYFNSKMTVMEHHFSKELNTMYSLVISNFCKLEADLINTQLILARLNPAEFANRLMKNDGYSAAISGEVIYLVKCISVYVSIRATEKCYHNIPISYNNQTMFVTPINRLIQETSEEIPCTPLMIPKYKFGNRWYTVDGRLREVPSPMEMTSDLNINWTYTHMGNLMSIGIYSKDNVKKMNDLLNDNQNKRTVMNIVQGKMQGLDMDMHHYRSEYLIDTQTLKTAIREYWDKFWSFSTALGGLTGFVVVIWTVFRIFKFVVDSIIHGKILYEIYGFSWMLIASLWDSITT